jgi:hypothetical protein
LRLAGVVVFGLWLAGLVAFSALVYRHFFLSEDFATYNQAWTLIAHGDLNPFDTVLRRGPGYGVPFVKADFELILWPLALVHLVFPQPVALLCVQDLAVAGCGLVTYLWILELLEAKQFRRSPAIAVASVVLLVTVIDAGALATVGFDFHTEPIATLFLLLAGRELWRGRPGRAVYFVAVVLLCGSFAAIMVVGLGVSALLAGPATRRSGMVLVAAGVAWTLLIALLGANRGSGLSDYAYLAGRTTLPAGGVLLIVKGIVSHPSRALDKVFSRYPYYWTHIRPVGIVGLASSWGFGVPAVVMGVDALVAQPNFSFAAFQNFAVLPFVLLGTVMVLVFVAEHFRHRHGPLLACLVAVIVLAEALSYGYQQSPATIRMALDEIPPGPAAGLAMALARAPGRAEVVSTMGVMGRFSSRRYCYDLDPLRPVPVHGGTIVFVFSTTHLELVTPAGLQRAVAYVRDGLHASVLVDSDGVTAFLWHPPPGTISVKIPAAVPPTR